MPQVEPNKVQTAINQVTRRVYNKSVKLFFFSVSFILLLFEPFRSVTGKLNYSCSFIYFVKCFVRKENEKREFCPFSVAFQQKMNGKWAIAHSSARKL